MSDWQAMACSTALPSVLALGLLTACACPPQAQAQAPSQSSTPTATTSTPQEKTMESPKRRVPSVAPVAAAGTRYEVVRGARSRGFSQNGGIIAAIDEASGKELWTLQVYQTTYDAQEEKDGQDRFITEMTLSPDHQQLLIKSENKKTYSVQLSDRSIKPQP